MSAGALAIAHTLSHAGNTATHKQESKENAQLQSVLWRRRGAALAIAFAAMGTSLYTADSLFNHEDTSIDIAALKAASSAVAVNTMLTLQMRRRKDGTIAWSDSYRNLQTDLAVSAITAFSVMVMPVFSGADSFGGMINSGLSWRLANKTWKYDDSATYKNF